MLTLHGHFDGKVVILDEPAEIAPNTKVTILAPTARENEQVLTQEFSKASEAAFQKIWDNSLDADYDRL